MRLSHSMGAKISIQDIRRHSQGVREQLAKDIKNAVRVDRMWEKRIKHSNRSCASDSQCSAENISIETNEDIEG